MAEAAVAGKKDTDEVRLPIGDARYELVRGIKALIARKRQEIDDAQAHAFGWHTFRHRRTGREATIMSGSRAEALKAHTIYPHAWEFVRWAPP